ncbi:hypothetical protein KORDIASMS9_02875 [Kordia sp. SMS9]|nr:hypothetical protein KORDIASMS9_02875 [Kordia sp. SMS9]
MKRKSIKSLQINKKSISSLQYTGNIIGRGTDIECTDQNCQSLEPINCPYLTPITELTVCRDTFYCSEIFCE